MEIDVSEVLQLGDDLEAAAGRLVAAVQPVVGKGALNIKRTMQADMAESRHFRQIAPTISYDVHTTQAVVEAQIGPRTGGAGSLANIAYFGGAHGGGRTVRDPLEAALEEQPRFEAALTAIIADLI